MLVLGFKVTTASLRYRACFIINSVISLASLVRDGVYSTSAVLMTSRVPVLHLCECLEAQM